MAGTPVEATIAAKKTKRNRMVFIPRLRERPTSSPAAHSAAAGFDAAVLEYHEEYHEEEYMYS